MLYTLDGWSVSLMSWQAHNTWCFFVFHIFLGIFRAIDIGPHSRDFHTSTSAHRALLHNIAQIGLFLFCVYCLSFVRQLFRTSIVSNILLDITNCIFLLNKNQDVINCSFSYFLKSHVCRMEWKSHILLFFPFTKIKSIWNLITQRQWY